MKTASKSNRKPPAKRSRKAAAKSIVRSRIAQGAHLPRVDGRTMYARRFRDLTVAHINDLGGIENVSTAEQSIIRRVVTISVALEMMERKFAQSGKTSAADLDHYQRASNALRRLLEATGIKRRARDVTPDLQDYIHGASQ